MKNFYRLLSIISFLLFVNSLFARNIVIEDTFDGNELSWTENGKPDLGENIIIDGIFKFDSTNQSAFFTKTSNTPNLLLSEGVMPIDPLQGFSIAVDMEFEHKSEFVNFNNDANHTSGILLEYDDDYNFVAVAVNEEVCYILIYKEGQLTRYKIAAVKMKGINKNKVNATLKIDYHDYKLKIYVDGIEMTEMRKVTIESPVIALFTTGKRKVSFDNVVVSQ